LTTHVEIIFDANQTKEGTFHFESLCCPGKKRNVKSCKTTDFTVRSTTASKCSLTTLRAQNTDLLTLHYRYPRGTDTKPNLSGTLSSLTTVRAIPKS